MNTLRNVWAEETGAVLAEYALMAALIAGMAVAAAGGLGSIVASKFQGGAEAFSAGPAPVASGGGPPPANPGGTSPVGK